MVRADVSLEHALILVSLAADQALLGEFNLAPFPAAEGSVSN